MGTVPQRHKPNGGHTFSLGSQGKKKEVKVPLGLYSMYCLHRQSFKIIDRMLYMLPSIVSHPYVPRVAV